MNDLSSTIKIIEQSIGQKVTVKQLIDESLDEIISLLSTDRPLVLVDYDRINKQDYLAIDNYLGTVDHPPVIVLMEDEINPVPEFQQLLAVPYHCDQIANLEILLDHTKNWPRSVGPTDKWLLLMRGPIWHRKYIFENLIPAYSNRLLWSYGKEKFLYNDFEFYNDPSKKTTSECNFANLIKLIPCYEQTCGSIVVESRLTDRYGDGFITEKTLHALVMMHPFIMIGPVGTVAYLRTQGFDVFDDIIDHSYDTINNHTERINSAFEKNSHIINKGLTRNDHINRLRHNQQHLATWLQQRQTLLSQYLITNI